MDISYDIDALKKELFWAQVNVAIVVAASFIASAYFVVKFFLGGNTDVPTWDNEQILYALMGLGIALSITIAHAQIWQSGKIGFGKTTLFIKMGAIICLFFGLFTEISQSLERSDEVVRYRSENSAVFQKTLDLIDGNKAPSVPAYLTDRIANASQRYQNCLVRKERGEERHCQGDEANLTSLKEQARDIMASSSNQSMQMLEKARQLERDESRQFAMIRFIKETFGLSSLTAGFFFSLIIIGTFEYAFAVLNLRVAEIKMAIDGLKKNGNRYDFATDSNEEDKPISQERANKKPPENALMSVWHALHSGRIKRLSINENGQIANYLVDNGHIKKGSNVAIREFASDVLEELASRGVIGLNRNHSNGQSKYIMPKKIPDPQNAKEHAEEDGMVAS